MFFDIWRMLLSEYLFIARAVLTVPGGGGCAGRLVCAEGVQKREVQGK